MENEEEELGPAGAVSGALADVARPPGRPGKHADQTDDLANETNETNKRKRQTRQTRQARQTTDDKQTDQSAASEPVRHNTQKLERVPCLGMR
jgi:hypothetical protein